MEQGTDYEMKGNLADQNVNIEIYRRHVRSYLDLHLYTAALFWADKALSISNGDPQDVYWLAQCMFLLKQYHRAAHLIRSNNLDKSHSLCHYLAVRSLLEAREFGDALQLLTVAETENSLSCTVDSSGAHNSGTDLRAHGDIPANLQSGILFLKGRVLEATENRGLAADCYRQALRCDVYCYEAFDALVQHHMLSSWEEQELLDMLPYSQQCSSPTEAKLLRELYETKLNKYQGPRIKGAIPPMSPSTSILRKSSNILDSSDVSINRSTSGVAKTADQDPEENPLLVERLLSSNLDVIVSKAERLYYNCNYRQCFRLTEDVLKKDPFHLSCLPVHIGCLVELKKTNQLFCLAHRLVDLHPEMAISWFAVGCYYYLKEGSSDPARRYLGKATSLDRLFGPAWLAFGHSFAADNEHDQAMAAYFKASQLMKGCHLPLLYIGLECGLTNNIKLAEKFFQQAQTIAPQDPFVIHEIGVIAFQNQDYEAAERHFEDALARVRAIDDGLTEKWESLLNNLGHVSRKRGKFEQAIEYHRQALVLHPVSPTTYSAMGYAHAILGNTAEAVDCFHKALGLRTDDTFSTTMLTYVIEELADKSAPFKDAPEGMPRLKSKNGPRSNVFRVITFEEHSPEDNSMSLELEGLSSTPLNAAPSASSPLPVDQYSSQLSFEVEMQDITDTDKEF